MTTYIKIGQIINTHGHLGELKVYPLTDDANRFYELAHVYIDDGSGHKEYKADKVRLHKNFVLLSLKEVLDMNEAEKLKGLYLELPVAELKSLPPGHYYYFEMIGLKVFEDNTLLGEITDIIKTGSNDVYVVKGEDNNKEILIPALKEVVKKIDLDSGKVQVKIPPGLLD